MDIFKIVADSQKMDGWNDSLSRMIDAVDIKYSKSKLSDEELMMVAGGVNFEKYDSAEFGKDAITVVKGTQKINNQ